MNVVSSNEPRTRNTRAWFAATLTGVVIPVSVLVWLFFTSSPLALAGGPVFTLGLMGVGIIGAAAAGRFRVGVLMAQANAACLLALAIALGLPALPHLMPVGVVMIIASLSFAARGALFAKTLTHKAWLMALFVVLGEASVLLIAAMFPGILPDWFLALLPAQWANIAIQTALAGAGMLPAASALLALAGTAATTLLAARLWFRRWPYPLMFTAWLGLSAVVYFSVAGSSSAGVEPTQRFEAVIPTVEQETNYIWRNLQDIPFFEENGYQVSLPDGVLIAALKDKARAGALNDEHYLALQTFMKEGVYRDEDYRRGYDKIVAVLPSLEKMVSTIEAQDYEWGFRVHARYPIMLTLYGPGGSYDPDSGTITMLTDTQGGFRQYANPLNTLIHEVVHIGIEESIVRQFSVPHGLKERLVDTFVTLHFAEALPDYRVQQMGDQEIDREFDDLESLERLPEIMSEFLSR
ncbi:MAG: hypothetical protein AAF004_14260 [Pseudomonadota bacterium]